jgi:hypothetical protein
MGLKKSVYWFANTTVDLVKYYSFALVAMAILRMFDADVLSSGQGFTVTALLLVLFGLPMIFFTYAFSLMFQQHASA